MDATPHTRRDPRLFAVRPSLCAILTLAGCLDPHAPFTVRREEPEPAPAPSHAVDVAATQPAPLPVDAAVDARIQQWIDNLDTVSRRVARDDRAPPARPATETRTGSTVAPPAPAAAPDHVWNPPRDGPGLAPPSDADRGDAAAGSAGSTETTPPPAATQPALKPPTLLAVRVRAAPDAAAAPAAACDAVAAPTQAPATAVNAPAAAHAPLTSLRDLLAQWPAAGEDASFRQQLDERILRIVAGDPERAREPLTLVSDEQQRLAAAFIESLIAVREGHLGDPQAAASAALQELEKLESALRRTAALRIPVVALCRAVHGFGQYDPIDPPRFLTGAPAEFVLYAEVAGFVSEPRDDGWFHAAFDLTTTIFNRAGEVVLRLEDPGIVDRCRNLRRDCFIPRLVRLPATLAPGEYVAKVTIRDTLAEKIAEGRATFRVVVGH